MSNWLEPAWARAVIATGRPEIGTAPCEEPDVATVVCVAALAATTPNVGRLAVADCTALVAACVFGAAEALADVDALPRAASVTVFTGEAFALFCCCAALFVVAFEELPAAGAFCGVLADAEAFVAAASAGTLFAAVADCVVGSDCCCVDWDDCEFWPSMRDRFVRARVCSPIAIFSGVAVVAVVSVVGGVAAMTGAATGA